MSKRAVIYVRVSKDRTNETSTATQEAEARELCERRGWSVVKVEKDQGRSAFKADVKRAGLDRAMRHLEMGAADVLVIWKLDRLHRGIVDFWETWRRIDSAGGQLASVTDDLDTTRAAGRMMVGLIAGFAEMESEAKSDRSKAWHAGRRADALPPVGPRPFGYERVGSTLAILEDEAAAIRAAANAVLAGDSLRSIVREWNAAGLRGGKWSHRGVGLALRSPTTSGRREFDGVLTDGNWPAILDAATSDKITALLRDPDRRNSSSNERKWMLSGFAECECGGRLLSKFHAKGKRYACRACGVSIRADILDGHVSASLLAAVDRKRWNEARRAGRAPAIDTEALGARLREIAGDYAAGRVDREVYEMAKAEQAKVIAESEAEPVELPDVDDLAASWVDLGPGQQLLAVSAFIDKVAIRPAGAGERIAITWRA